ncbi:DEAD/DEAH box helicase family protein [Patescibacteria group bacterium]|nr:DEAD/DEAH box helicase family protein [Patescibacteria group bacterium]
MYIALDIETTGLNQEKDDIIEIGATKFDDKRIIDRYTTFLSIDYDIPEIITHITGIKSADLIGAPHLEDIQEALLDFIGDLPIVGHNISFDIDFLAEKGLVLDNKMYDTLPLSGILIPGMHSYSLGILTEKLGISHENQHRALDDAVASAELFQILMKKITEIDPETLNEIKELVEKTEWPLKRIFLEAKAKTSKKSKKPKKNLSDQIEANQNNKEFEFNKDEILSFYNEDGHISKLEEDYEVRQPQIQMTTKIIDAFNDERNLLCEAGTGTGKSIAYILPSAFLAKANDQKVVIATHTKTLQDQLYKKDVPVVQKALKAYMGLKDGDVDPLKVTVLKGRQNYLSVERFNQFRQKDSFQDHEITLLMKILIWLPNTRSGDLEELSLQGKEYFAWNEVCCDIIKCPHHDASFSMKCFLSKARESAQNADIIITNHALLLSDTTTPTQVLPQHDHLIVDEAHHLEAEATEALTITLTNDSLDRPLRNLRNLAKKYLSYVDEIDILRDRIVVFFGLLGIFFEKNSMYANSIQNLQITSSFQGTLEWQKVTDSAENVRLQCTQLIKALREHIKEEEDEEIAKLMGIECDSLQEHISNLAIVTEEALESNLNKQITWIFQKFDGSLGIKSAPIEVGDHLNGTLFHEKKSIILTSATLTVNKTFDYMRQQLQLDETFDEAIIPSHFSYQDQVELNIYEDLQPPNSHGYFDQSASLIYETVIGNTGKTLVLFTSKKAIEATYLKLATALKEKGITILAQNISGGRNKILELFKKDPDSSVIFGTNTFWEGVDIKGSALSCVIIQKLPFDPPDDPIHKARSELLDDPFYQYQIPRAILRFKQGFGRLIRSAKDSGKVIILDSRIITKSYGRNFLMSLPEGIRINRKYIRN